jgi:transcriptional regulator with XRE-family HTH domain
LRNAKVSPIADAPLATFGQRIRAVRGAWGWSQLKLASTLGLDQATISFWEQDKIIPGGTSTVAIAALFRTSIESLETGAGFVIPDPPSDLPQLDQHSFRSVSLPSLAQDQLSLVDITNGTARGADTSQTIFELTDALKEGRKVWLVLQ